MSELDEPTPEQLTEQVLEQAENACGPMLVKDIMTTDEAVLRCFGILIDNSSRLEGEMINARGRSYEAEMQAIRRQRLITELSDANNRLHELLYDAWVVIANVNGGNMEDESPDWRKAAERWRDKFHKAYKGPLQTEKPYLIKS